jgi:tetratricopeptide (TPR) repeat protein
MTVGVNQIKYLVQAPGPGTYDIGPAVFVVQEPVAGTRRRGNDPLGSLFKDSFFNPARTRPVRVVSNALSLEVTPLPAYQGNVQFSGLVGTFTLAASLDKTRVPAGASATLSLVVQGRGNVMDMGTLMPDLDETQVKVYPDAPQEDISSTGLAGKKVFRTALVPRQPGVIDIPKVGLTFFDPEARTYKTITTQPLTLEVLPGTNTDFQAAQKSLGAESETAKDRPEDVPAAKAEVTIKNRDILDIREDISAIHPVVRLPLPWFVLWLMLPGAGFGLFALVLGRWRSAPDTRAQARKKAAALIQKAGAADPEDPVFLPALRSSLTALILARSGRQAENLTCAEASALLRDSGVDDTEAAQMVEMMQTLDQARFGGKPLDPAAAETHLKQIRAWAKALVFVLALSLPLAPSAARAAASATQFVDAVKDYKAGRFEQAAMGFEAIAAAGVDNPGLFYNTGNAWLRDNNLGRAILWYERALRLAPSDPDIQFNLAHARTRVTDQVDHPLTARDILFFWKGWVSLRRLQLAAVAGSCVFFLWAAGRMVQRRKVISGAGTVILVIVVLVTAAAFLEAARLDRDTRAVILSPEVQVRSGTQDTATPLFDLHAGTIVNVLEKKSNHIKISIARNKVGWVCLADAEII